MPTITLMRHGLPDAPAGEWLTAHGFAGWVRRYDAAPVTPACPPPAAALEQARPCGAVVCSDLPRSLSSAALLGVRPAQAALWLAALAARHGSVLLVGHGVFNRLLAHQLQRQGWQRQDAHARRHWSFCVLRHDSPAPCAARSQGVTISST